MLERQSARIISQHRIAATMIPRRVPVDRIGKSEKIRLLRRELKHVRVKKTQAPVNRKRVLQKRIKELQRCVRKELRRIRKEKRANKIKKLKKLYTEDLISWRDMAKSMGFNSNEDLEPKSVKDKQGRVHHGGEQFLKELENFWCKILQQEQCEEPEIDEFKEFVDNNWNKEVSPLMDHSFTIEEVGELVRKLPMGKSPGPQVIIMNLLSYFSQFLPNQNQVMY